MDELIIAVSLMGTDHPDGCDIVNSVFIGVEEIKEMSSLK